MEDASIWLFFAAVGVAAAALLWAGYASVITVVDPVRRRLKQLQHAGDHAVEISSSATRSQAGRLWKLFEPTKEGERQGVQLKLVRAGYRTGGAIGVLYAIKLLIAAALPVLVLAAMSASKTPIPLIATISAGLAAAFVGSLLPDLYLARRWDWRKEKLMEGLPDALDLLVTCTEAGLGLNAALERVVEQLPASHPELATELAMVNAEIRAGIDRNTALKNLGERTGLEEIHGLVSLIAHSSRLGTGIAGTLRIYAEDFRDRRMQRAEEIAATVGTKLMFPLLVCLFPAFFVVAVGPAIFGVIKALADK